MSTKFISTVPRQGLYCVWITTGNPRQPLACVWIDPQLRCYEWMDVQQTSATCLKTSQPADKAEVRRVRKAHFSTPVVTPNAPRRWRAKKHGVARSFARIVNTLSVPLNLAWADAGGRIVGVISDLCAALVAGATVTLRKLSNGVKQTATAYVQGRWRKRSCVFAMPAFLRKRPGLQPVKSLASIPIIESRDKSVFPPKARSGGTDEDKGPPCVDWNTVRFGSVPPITLS